MLGKAQKYARLNATKAEGVTVKLCIHGPATLEFGLGD